MSLWQIWWIALAVKTILLPIIPVTPDEAYYFVWARHPSLSYFDHPPFIAWIMTLALPLWKTSLGIRWPGVIFSHLGYIPWIGILRRLKFSNEAQIIWMLGLLLGPLTGVGGFVITPDVPLVFFWSLGMWTLLWLLEKPTVMRWMCLGLVFGLGMLSKYVMVLFIPATVIWLWWEGRSKELSKPGPWIAGLVALMVSSPVLIWNYQNQFASFLFQTRHGLSSSHFKWNWPVEYIGTQFALLNPFVSAIAIMVIWKRAAKNKFLVVFSATPFVFFFLTSFRARVEANWPICAYPSLVALAASVVDWKQAGPQWSIWLKRGYKFSLLFVLLVISHTVHPWLPLRKDRDHTEITREWLIDVPALKKYQPLFARSYQLAAFHSYFRSPDNEVFKMAGLNRPDFYDFIPESVPTKKSYLILSSVDLLPEKLQEHYEIKNPIILPSKLVLYELDLK